MRLKIKLNFCKITKENIEKMIKEAKELLVPFTYTVGKPSESEYICIPEYMNIKVQIILTFNSEKDRVKFSEGFRKIYPRYSKV